MQCLAMTSRGFLGSILSIFAIFIVNAIGTFLKFPFMGPPLYWFLSGVAVGGIMVAFTLGHSDNMAKFRLMWGGMAFVFASLVLALIAVVFQPNTASYALPAIIMLFVAVLFTVGLVGMFGVMAVVVAANMWGNRVASKSAVDIMPQALRDELAKKNSTP